MQSRSFLTIQGKRDFQEKCMPDAASKSFAIRKAVEASSGKVPENFGCNLCQQLLADPHQCSECNLNYCKECIEKWLQKGNGSCPKCKERMQVIPINRILRKFLDQTVLSGCPQDGCDKNQTEMTYEQLCNHIAKECKDIQIYCPLKCGSYFKQQRWEKHFDEECTEVKLACSICQEMVGADDQDHHNCMSDLKGRVEGLNEEVVDLRGQVQSLTEQTRSQQQLIEKLMQQNQKIMNQMEEIMSSKNFTSQPQPENQTPRQAQPNNPFAQLLNGVISQSIRKPLKNSRIFGNKQFILDPNVNPPKVVCAVHRAEMTFNSNRNCRCDGCGKDLSRVQDSRHFTCQLCPGVFDICIACISDPNAF